VNALLLKMITKKHIVYIILFGFFIKTFVHAETCNQILFYNSETNINNYKQLKIEFDRYFGKIGKYTFQPFDDKNIFENQLKQKRFCMIIVSSWYFNLLQNNISINPILIAHRKGVSTQQIILVKKITHGNGIAGGNVATSMSNVYSNALLKKILDNNDDYHLNVLRVPKDIDALMAVGFGMSMYALSTVHSFHTLSKINSPLYNKLSCIGNKVDAPLMICAVSEQTKNNKLRDALLNINKNPQGKNSIKMLGIDGFKEWKLTNRTD